MLSVELILISLHQRWFKTLSLNTRRHTFGVGFFFFFWHVWRVCLLFVITSLIVKWFLSFCQRMEYVTWMWVILKRAAKHCSCVTKPVNLFLQNSLRFVFLNKGFHLTMFFSAGWTVLGLLACVHRKSWLIKWMQEVYYTMQLK